MNFEAETSQRIIVLNNNTGSFRTPFTQLDSQRMQSSGLSHSINKMEFPGSNPQHVLGQRSNF
jgi:hypothetical protein